MSAHMFSVSLSYQLLPTPALFMASPPRSGPGPAATNQTVLQLTVSNLTAQPVTLTYLKLALPLGAGAADLLDLGARPTLAQLQAVVAPVPDPAWTLAQTSIEADAQGQLWASYLLHPRAGVTLARGASWTFGWQGVAPTYLGIPVNTVPGGPVGFLITEGQATGSASLEKFLTKAPAGWFEPTLTAATATVPSGQSVALTWNGPAGATYSLNELGPGAPSPLPNAGTYASAPLTHDTVFTLDVQYDKEQASPQQTVLVPLPPLVIEFTGTVSGVGKTLQVLLSWTVTPADAYAEVVIAGIDSPFTSQGSLPVLAEAGHDLPTSFTLTATSPAGQTATARLAATYVPSLLNTVTVGDGPNGIVFTADSSQAWVGNGIDGTVSVIDTTTFQPINTLSVGNKLAITPNGQQVWVSNGGLVTVLSTANYQPITTINLQYWGVSAIAFTPDGTRAWITNGEYGPVQVLDTATYQTVSSYGTINNYFFNIAISPDGKQAWITGSMRGLVTVIDTATGAFLSSSSAAGLPQAIAFTPSGQQAWVVDIVDSAICVFDTATYAAIGSSINVGSMPQAIAITPDGHQAWVTNGADNTVTVLDTTTYQPIGKPIGVGDGPGGIAILPNGRQAWVANSGGTTVSIIAIGVSGYAPVPPSTSSSIDAFAE